MLHSYDDILTDLLTHILGFNSQIARLPNDNFGVAVLTNDHDYGRVTTQIIKYYIMDRALGLNPIDWNGRLVFSLPC